MVASEVAASQLPPVAHPDVFYLMPTAARRALVLPGGSALLGPLVFAPTALLAYNSSVYVRNNLTLVYNFEVAGVGGTGTLMFEPRWVGCVFFYFYFILLWFILLYYFFQYQKKKKQAKE